ncbi:MAG: HAD-IA family hydrolase [Spirochaetes bacterium]|nr:HAD-IA family hydrolase [Spirochaetota bacterium]
MKKIYQQFYQKKIKKFRIKAILFDFDGTLTEPAAIDFQLIRKEIGCSAQVSILEYIEKITDPEEQKEKYAILDHYETISAKQSVPQAFTEEAIIELKKWVEQIGIITRNSKKSVQITFANFQQLTMNDFDLIITRDDEFAPKPSGEGILHASKLWNLPCSEILMVGDFKYDIEAAKAAQAWSAFLKTPVYPDESICQPDFVIEQLHEVVSIVKMGLPLPNGKIPNDLLDTFLHHISSTTEQLLTPQVGEDTAVIELKKDHSLVITSDPITFVSGKQAEYSIIINSNDLATSGAQPRWFMVTLLFPPVITQLEIMNQFQELNQVANDFNISLCGGHSEITDAVTRPIISGTLLGEIKKEEMINKKDMSQGDLIFVTKQIAMEGTAIIAAEFSDLLATHGLLDVEIEEAKNMVEQISILKEAQIAVTSGGITGLHDVTEGGIATALQELAAVSHHQLKIHIEKIPIAPLTDKICSILHLDPLGLIGSGSLLISCKKDRAKDLSKTFSENNLILTQIGEVGKDGGKVIAFHHQKPAILPEFKTDEITKLYL